VQTIKKVEANPWQSFLLLLLQELISSNKWSLAKWWNYCSKWLFPARYHCVTVFSIIFHFVSTFLRKCFYSAYLLWKYSM